MNEREAGVGQHGLDQARDAADDVEADADRAAESGKVVNQLGHGGWRVRQPAIDQDHAVGVDGGDPVNLLGDVDPDADAHGASWRCRGPATRPRRRRPTQRWIAEPNQRSRRVGGAGGSASRAIQGSQHENHPGTAA